MRKWCVAVVSVTVAALVAGCGNGRLGGSPGGASSSADFTAVGQKLDSYVGNTVNGYAFVLVGPNQTLYESASGTIDVNTPMEIASASKAPAVAAIMTLVDQGKLNLDTPISQYLGSTIFWPQAKQAITLRMLLDHTSGLPGIGPNDKQPLCLNNQTSTTLQQCAQQIALTQLDSTPGTTFNYGGADYQVAGYVATLVAGEDWHTLFQNAIAGPLGMSSFTYDSGSDNPRIAGGGKTDVTDYARFVRMMLGNGSFNGTAIITPSSVQEMEKNEINGLPVTYTPADSASYPGYGLGLFITSPSLYSGSPGPEFSDPGLLGATPWFDVGLNYGAVLFIDPMAGNSETPDAVGRDMWNAVRPIIIDQLNPN